MIIEALVELPYDGEQSYPAYHCCIKERDDRDGDTRLYCTMDVRQILDGGAKHRNTISASARLSDEETGRFWQRLEDVE